MKRFVLLLLVAATVQAQHPITFENLASIHRIGAPQTSPDRKTIAYAVSTPNLTANRSNSAIFMVPATGGASTKTADLSEAALV